MNKLDSLGKELRQELGEPPADWALQQRRRLRAVRIDRRHPAVSWRLAVIVTLACALAAVALWVGARSEGKVATDTSDAGIWLDAEATAVFPYRTPDGSSIRLEAGSQGRFSSHSNATIFELHHGRGHFEVAHRPHQDFRVVAGRYEVRVVGTRFSVQYDGASQLGVRVENGRVAVRVPQRAEPVVLEAGDSLDIRGHQFTLRAHDQHGAFERNGELARSERDLAHTDSGATAKDAPNDTRAAEAGRQGRAPRVPSPASTASNASSEPDWHVLYQRGEYRAALKLAKSRGFLHLTQSLAAPRLIALADTARLGGDSEAALMALRALESRFPGSAASADAGFLIGRLHAQRGESAAAIRRLSAYLERGDDARYSLEATGRLMELYVAAGNQLKARALARRYLRRAPEGPYQRLATSVLVQK